MESYTFFYMMIAVVFLVVMINRYIPLWSKGLIGVYYIALAVFFVTQKNRIEQKYEQVLPVPWEYWDENSALVQTISNFFFIPLVGILLYVYVRWFVGVQSRLAKVSVVASLVPALAVFLFFLFFFNMGYGYSP